VVLRGAARGGCRAELTQLLRHIASQVHPSPPLLFSATLAVLMDLFGDIRKKNLDSAAPLAVRMRPRNLDEFCGAASIFLGPGKLLRRMLEGGPAFVGAVVRPAGDGEDDGWAQIIANSTKSHFEQVNAGGGRG